MVHIHGSWGHFVRPGITDPKRYGTEAAMGLKKRRKKVDTSRPKLGEFRIWGENGQLLYQCAEKKSIPVLALIEKQLPMDAFTEVDGGVRLDSKLDELEFGSRGDFAHWCAHGGTHEKGWYESNE